MFTDNQVAERAVHRGTSTSRLLFELVLRLKKLEMEGCIFLHVIWVAGTRMIAQGTDGLSRGDLGAGVCAGLPMLRFVPIGDSCIDRQPELARWLLHLLPGHWRILTPEGWFDDAYQKGLFVWTPPPAAAEAALDSLCEARHVRPYNGHIFAVPNLMSTRWRKKLGKVADILLTVPVGSKIWEEEQHEPLTVALVFPLMRRSPWQVQFLPHELVGSRDKMSEMWDHNPNALRGDLRKLWRQTGFG